MTLLSANFPIPLRLLSQFKIDCFLKKYYFPAVCSKEIPNSPTLKAPEVMKCCHSTCQLLWDKFRLLCSLLIITLPSSEFFVPYPHLQVLMISAFLLKILQWFPLNTKPNFWHDQSPAYFPTLFCTSSCSPSVGHSPYLPEPQIGHFVSPYDFMLNFFYFSSQDSYFSFAISQIQCHFLRTEM